MRNWLTLFKNKCVSDNISLPVFWRYRNSDCIVVFIVNSICMRKNKCVSDINSLKISKQQLHHRLHREFYVHMQLRHPFFYLIHFIESICVCFISSKHIFSRWVLVCRRHGTYESQTECRCCLSMWLCLDNRLSIKWSFRKVNGKCPFETTLPLVYVSWIPHMKNGHLCFLQCLGSICGRNKKRTQ